MRQIVSDAFNETLVALIEELKQTISAVPPEAVRLLPVELVDKARLITSDEFRLDDMATANSIDGYKLNSMIRYITSNNFEFYLGEERIQNQANEAWDNNDNGWVKLTIRHTINLPNGWDGRNGFANFTNNFYLLTLRDLTGKHNLNAKNLLTQNEKTIEIDMDRSYIDNNGSWVEKDETTETSWVTVRYILWRRKNV